MSTTITTQQEFYDLYKNEVVGNTSELTDFSEGSLHDILAGAITTGLNEVSELVVSEFMKTFFSTAEGLDLERLAKDHFGDSFARPLSVPATGEVTFSRANTNAGNVTILAGTIVKTKKDANGQEIRFKTTEQVILTGLSINAPIEAVNPGKNGNAGIGTISVLESTLSDPIITVSNAASMAGGADSPDDAEYREIIKNKILALAGATDAAVRGAALAVAGVGFAELITVERVVIDYDIANDQILPGAKFFRMPYPIVYIADDSGNSSQALIDSVSDALQFVRACGVRLEVKGAQPVVINWTGSLTLNVSGPNYAELSADLTKIKDSMTEYINSVLPIGGDFIKATANAYIMSIWGPSGTNDLTAFSSSIPSGNVSVAENQKPVAGAINIV